MSSQNYYLSSTEYAIAGAATGIFTRCTCQPLDVLKIRFQLQSTGTKRSGIPKYQSIFQAARRIRNEEGIRALWKGHISAQCLSVVFGAAQFATYEICTNQWRKHSAAHFLGGAVSGVVAVSVSFPFDTIRTRLVAQGEPKLYRGMVDVTRRIIAVDGWRGLFFGLVPACIQTAPMAAMIFGFNNIFSSMLKASSADKNRNLNTVESLFCGAMAGFWGKTIVYPFDLIKKRLQTQSMPDGTSASGPLMRTSGMLHCLKKTYSTESTRGLYKGFAPSVVKAAVSYSLYLTCYDKICMYLAYVKTIE